MAAPSPAPRARLQLDERRAQLVELGLRLFAERSYDEVSIDDIAGAAGISKGLLYHYFGSKRDFYVATIQAAADQLTERIQPDMSLTPAARSRAGISAYLDFVEEHAGAYSALMRGGIGSDPSVGQIVDQTRDRIIHRMLTEIGVKLPRPIFRTALRGWIGLVEATSLDFLDKREVDRDIVVRMLSEALFSTLVIAMRLDPDSGFEFTADAMPPGGILAIPTLP